MIIARVLYSGNLYYGFLLWNLLLAGIPLIISQKLYTSKTLSRFVMYVGLFFWILFLPNAPYIITDLVHLFPRPPVPFWYDMMLVVLSACNGMALGFASIFQIETILFRTNSGRFPVLFRIAISLSMSYGVFLGRYLRFNSWDAVFSPFDLMKGVLTTFQISAFGFVLTFSFVTFILYSFFRLILPLRSQ